MMNLNAEIKSFDEGELERWLEALEAMRQRANWASDRKSVDGEYACFGEVGEQELIPSYEISGGYGPRIIIHGPLLASSYLKASLY